MSREQAGRRRNLTQPPLTVFAPPMTDHGFEGREVAGADLVNGSSAPGTPALILAVEADATVLADLERELRERYARHYVIACAPSAGEALAVLEERSARGEDVALAIAGGDLGDMTGAGLLARVGSLHPQARRALLLPWGIGDPGTGAEIQDAIARGAIDHYLLRPSAPPDELFHATVSGFLLDWAEASRSAPHTIHVVGESWSGRAYELRDVLQRCALPHSFHLADSDTGRSIIDRVRPASADLPLVLLPSGTLLANPSEAEVALGVGSSVEPGRTDFDVVIVGAGPAGLSAAVYGASEGFETLVIDSGGIGGQATSSALIRNYLGFPRGISGGQLAQRAYNQAWLFGARFALMQHVSHLGRHGHRLVLDLSHSGRVNARAVILATGASYRRLGIPALEALNGAGVFYGGSASEAAAMAGREAYVVGGANSAGQAALHLSQYARNVTICVRAASLGAGMSRYLVEQIEASPSIRVRLRTHIVDGGGEGHLQHLVLRHADGNEETVAADGLFLMIGALPNTDWLPPEIRRDSRGYVVTGPDLASEAGWPLERAPFPFETSMPRVLAIGDARHGSVKRVASAVGAGSIAIQTLHAFAVEDRLHPPARSRSAVA